VPLHEWKETFEFNYSTGLYDLGTEHSPTTWIFEAGSFVPCGKIVNGKHYSIITDHLGTPIEAYNQEGELIWEREQDLYGNSRQGFAKKNFRCPFKYQGQYYDPEIELCYNRFRYYHPETGRYISEDPIKLLGGFNVFAYVSDSNAWLDVLGLNEINDLGKIGEENAGIIKNTKKIPSKSGKVDFRVPDEMSNDERLIKEVKNVNYQYFSSQLKDDIAHVNREGGEGIVILIVDNRTRLSPQLQREIDEKRIVLERKDLNKKKTCH